MRSRICAVAAVGLLGTVLHGTTEVAVAQVLPPEARAGAPVLPRHVALPPEVTDPEIDFFRPGAEHYVWLTEADRSNPKLFVFLPGTNNPPREWQLLGAEAARLGYHAIMLMYKNDRALEVVCPDAGADPDCAINVRLEIIDGIDRSERVDVSPANSIDNRLTKLLQYLSVQFPAEGWSSFLEDGAPKWSQITVSGQSQGAGEAVLIGMLRQVHRIVTFSGWADADHGWVSVGATPSVKHYAVIHQRDRFFTRACEGFRALELERFGGCDPVEEADLVENREPPYGGMHILVTNLTPQSRPVPDPFHPSTARDTFTPLAPDGTPLLLDAWQYVLGEPPHAGP